MEEERLIDNHGLQVSLQETKGLFNYASLTIRAETVPATKVSWQRLTTLAIHPHTPEPLDDHRLPTRHRAVLASPK